MSLLWPFLIYFVISFVVSYVLVEYGQKYLYDEMPPYTALRVAAGSLIMAAVLTWTRSSFATMFTNDIQWTVLLMIIWSAVFVLIFRFQPIHGAFFAVVTALLLPGMASIAVEGATAKSAPAAPASTRSRVPIRRSTGVGGPAPAPAPEGAAKPAPAPAATK